jgi:hypothetical protein
MTGESPCTVVLEPLTSCSMNVSESSSWSRFFRASLVMGEGEMSIDRGKSPAKPPISSGSGPISEVGASARAWCASICRALVHCSQCSWTANPRSTSLSVCASFRAKKTVDLFYTWSETCHQVVPVTRGHRSPPLSQLTDVPS